MRRWLFNEREHEVFQQLIWDGYPFAVLVYVMELRPHMDAATCIVGDRRKVSHAGICEMLERHSKAGSHSGAEKKRDRHYVKRQIAALEDYGLVLRLPKATRNSPMRLKLLLADTGSFRPQEDRSMSALAGALNKTSGVPASSKPDNTRASLERSCVDNSEGVPNENTRRSAQHQVSGHTEYMNTPGYTACARALGDLPIPDDWAPDDLLIKELQRVHRLPEPFIREQAVLFRMRAKERGYVRHSWRDGFRLWVERGVRERFAEYQQFLDEQ